jgi:hypothetical protein
VLAEANAIGATAPTLRAIKMRSLFGKAKMLCAQQLTRPPLFAAKTLAADEVRATTRTDRGAGGFTLNAVPVSSVP